jgi:hypothetical protein
MDHPRNLFVFGGVFLVLALLPIVPVVYSPGFLDLAPKIVFISYVQTVKIIILDDQSHQFEWFTLIAVAGLLVVGIIVPMMIIHKLEKKR